MTFHLAGPGTIWVQLDPIDTVFRTSQGETAERWGWERKGLPECCNVMSSGNLKQKLVARALKSWGQLLSQGFFLHENTMHSSSVFPAIPLGLKKKTMHEGFTSTHWCHVFARYWRCFTVVFHLLLLSSFSSYLLPPLLLGPIRCPATAVEVTILVSCWGMWLFNHRTGSHVQPQELVVMEKMQVNWPVR